VKVLARASGEMDSIGLPAEINKLVQRGILHSIYLFFSMFLTQSIFFVRMDIRLFIELLFNG
jgi:hypothetical protein